jgi:PAS domain-containing protein
MNSDLTHEKAHIGLANQSGPSRLGIMRLMEGCPIGAVIITQDGLMQYANLQAEKQFRIKRSVLIGVHLRMMFGHPQQFDQLLATFKTRNALNGVEVEMRRLNDKNFWAMTQWEETRFNDQSAIIIWICDISVQKLSEESLQKMFDAAPLPMMLCSFPDGIVKRSNRRANELFVAGATELEFRLSTITGDKLWRSFSNRLRGGGFVDDFEVTLKTAYGESFFGMLSGQLLEVGGVDSILVGAADITDRKEAEDTMLGFFDNAPLVMMLARTSVARRNSLCRAMAQTSVISTGAWGRYPRPCFWTNSPKGGLSTILKCIW